MTIGQDYEIICVNDGATDESPKILQDYQQKGVTVVNQQNAGCGAARNHGADVAKGEYLWFVDSDDMIRPNCLKTLYGQAKQSKADVLAFNFVSVEDDTPLLSADEYNALPVFPAQLIPSRSLLKREFVRLRGIKWKEEVLGPDDTIYIFWVRFFNALIVETSHKIYAIRQRPGSITRSRQSREVLSERGYKAMSQMIEEYTRARDNYKNDPSVNMSIVLPRLRFATQHLLFHSLFCKTSQEQKALIKILKANGLYPYPIFWDTINLKFGKRNLVYNLFCLFLPIRFYYTTMAKLVRLRKGK